MNHSSLKAKKFPKNKTQSTSRPSQYLLLQSFHKMLMATVAQPFYKQVYLLICQIIIPLLKLLHRPFTRHRSYFTHMHSYQPKLSSPSHSEWGLINSLKQKEYEEALKNQKIIEQQKKQAFRNQLQNQLRMKQHGDMRQKSQDKAYYDFIVNKTRQEENKSQQEKYQKYLTRKEIDEKNRLKQMEERETMSNSRFKPDESAGQQKYLIGFRDQSSIKMAQHLKKQAMLQDMEHQLRLRQHAKKQQRLKEIQQFNKSLHQQDQLSRSQNSKQKFKQNQQVYQYYNSLYQQKQDQIHQLEYSFVDKPMMNKIMSEDMISKRKSYDEVMRKRQIKDALDQQMDEHRVKQMVQRSSRPEEVSYSFFGQMFDQASKGYGQYDKKSYNEYLRKQIEEQRENKKKLEFMDEREYLYNVNQINKALTGTYLKDTYHDNSIANVGEKLKVSPKPLDTIDNPQAGNERQKIEEQDEDKKLIKNNLQELLKKNTLPVKMPLTQKESPYSTRKSHY